MVTGKTRILITVLQVLFCYISIACLGFYVFYTGLTGYLHGQ